MNPKLSFTKNFLDLLSSMRFAVSLLSVLGVASVIGTVLKQNEPYENYIVKFGQFWFAMFEYLGLYDVYHSVWFLVILLFLVISTSLCIYRNTPAMLKEWRTFKDHATEKSLRAFSHQATFNLTADYAATKQNLLHFLNAKGFKYKIKAQEDGSELIAAKAGTHQRWGYIFTHVAMVVILFGGLLDGNLPFKVQEMLGYKRIETLDLPVSKVPAESRMSVSNPSFRGNMTLSEGATHNVAFLRVRDGYLVQELPFAVGLKDFRIEHYATGQPKSFESDLVIFDPELKEPITKTISVNHPLTYKGIAIYQSDFQDGGTGLKFNVWDLFSPSDKSRELTGAIFDEGALGEGDDLLRVEYNDFRKFNIINMSPDGKGKPHNVGPNVTYKLRDSRGQAIEYVTYMQPMQIDGKFYFLSGMRETVQEDFRYLRIPADEDLSINGFMGFRAVMLDQSKYQEIAKRIAKKSLGVSDNPEIKKQFELSLVRLLTIFAQGGYSEVAKVIEQSVPEKEREASATTYIKMVNIAAYEAYNMGLELSNKPLLKNTPETEALMRDSLNAFSDMFFYGAPYYLQLNQFEHKEASGLQLTKSPGQKWVYLGSVILVLGIFSMMYIRERRIWLYLKPSANEVHFAMASNRKNLDFEKEFSLYREQLAGIVS
ncbi:MAG TPA: cytochrome C biogenesis protein [Methylotenera mobilis]|uniref:Cytochrome C biogenesis protein n=1 Tax=Methylotenera mobilis TaxID=359408 RepID=A0A351RC48_9PROT|nr:MAG: cytochrome C biogenesis protein [Methylotenera sp.]HBA09619.1 cytochrome C biogenesis protein [Methylotenera mobilis]